MTQRRLPPPPHDPGATHGTQAYHRGRAEEERTAAGLASCMVKDIHLDLAELHDMRADSAARPAALPSDEPRSARR